jgi:AraC-like DNA-binding protein
MNDYRVSYNRGAVLKSPEYWNWTFSMLDYDLWVVLEGVGEITINGNFHNVSSGSVVLLAPGCSGFATHDIKNPITVVAIHFDYPLGLSDGHAYLYTDIEQVSFVEELMRHAIYANMKKNQDDADFWLSAALRKIFPSDDQFISQRYNKDIEQLCEKIISHPEKKYTVSNMAAKLCICKDHFSRIFKIYKGVSPHEFVIKARIERACSILLSSDLNASEIANELGYSSVNFFCRQFKTHTGKPPQQFRDTINQ